LDLFLPEPLTIKSLIDIYKSFLTCILMSVMDMVRNWSEKRKEKSETFKKMQEQDRLDNMLQERKKSSNRRELEKHFKDEEEAEIKKQLDIIHKKQNKDNWKSNSILNKDNSIMKTDRPILKEKNIFKNNKNMFVGNKSMFKW